MKLIHRNLKFWRIYTTTPLHYFTRIILKYVQDINIYITGKNNIHKEK